MDNAVILDAAANLLVVTSLVSIATLRIIVEVAEARGVPTDLLHLQRLLRHLDRPLQRHLSQQV